MVLEGAGNDLRRAGTALVHQDHDAQVGEHLALTCAERLALIDGPSPGLHHHLARFQEQVRDGNPLVQGPPRIPPQVEDQLPNSLPEEGIHSLPDLPRGGLGHRLEG